MKMGEEEVRDVWGKGDREGQKGWEKVQVPAGGVFPPQALGPSHCHHSPHHYPGKGPLTFSVWWGLVMPLFLPLRNAGPATPQKESSLYSSFCT